MQPLAQDFPVVPNDKGGFNILLKPTATAATLTPPPAPAMAPGGAASAASPQARPEGAWVDDLMQTVGAGGTGDSRAQYEPPPDMGGALPESGGPLSRMLPAGWGDTAAAAVGGLNTIKRDQSPLAAFGAGMAGAMDVREGRRKSKREEMLADQERQWKQEDRLYNRGIEGEKLGLLKSADVRAAAAEGRAGKEAEREELQDVLSVQVKQAELKKVNIELERLATSKGLTVDQGLEAVKQGVALTEREFTDVPIEDEETRKAYQQSLIRNTQAVIQQLSNAIGGGGAAGAPAGGASGTQATPIAWAPGAAPRDAATFKAQMDAAVAANGGQPVWYINPSDKRVLPYTGRTAAGPPV